MLQSGGGLSEQANRTTNRGTQHESSTRDFLWEEKEPRAENVPVLFFYTQE
jgi:hypothetical protein